MNREEAITDLQALIGHCSNMDSHDSLCSVWKQDIEALKMGIEALQSVTPKNDNSVLEDIKAEIRQWYWQADKQKLAEDPCVVDAMVDLFIRTIDKHISGKESHGTD